MIFFLSVPFLFVFFLFSFLFLPFLFSFPFSTLCFSYGNTSFPMKFDNFYKSSSVQFILSSWIKLSIFENKNQQTACLVLVFKVLSQIKRSQDKVIFVLRLGFAESWGERWLLHNMLPPHHQVCYIGWDNNPKSSWEILKYISEFLLNIKQLVYLGNCNCKPSES